MMIHPRHVKAAGYCVHIGARRWFAFHGLDFRAFMREGLPVEAAEGIDDVFMRRVIAEAEKEHGLEQKKDGRV